MDLGMAVLTEPLEVVVVERDVRVVDVQRCQVRFVMHDFCGGQLPSLETSFAHPRRDSTH